MFPSIFKSILDTFFSLDKKNYPELLDKLLFKFIVILNIGIILNWEP